MDQRLYGMESVLVGHRDGGHGALGSRLLQGKIDEKLILRHWDDVARVAGSLKMGWA